MKVKINETNEEREIKYVIAGQAMEAEIIGNHGGFGKDQNQFSWDEDLACYVTSESNYAWWATTLAKLQAQEEAGNRLAQ